jgi:tRNA-binding protein
MKAHLFYDFRTLGDVLLIVIDLKTKPTRVEQIDNVVALYEQDRLVGVNIFAFSEIVKIKNTGLIILPPKPLIDVINHMLRNANLETLDEIGESGFRIGQVLSCEEHPDSDHLHVCKVDVGNAVLDIVCGAPNVVKGMKTVVAMPGTMMFDGSEIVPSELRGVASSGMLCSPRELHLDNAPQVRGLIVLESDAPVGHDFFKFIGETTHGN